MNIILQILFVVEISVLHELVVALAYAEPDFLPCNLIDLLDAFFGDVAVEAVVGAERVDGVCHGVNVPIIDFKDVGEDFAASRLFGDDAGAAALHGFEGSDAEGLADGRHDEDIGVLVALIDLFAALEAGEVAAVGNAVGGRQLYHRVHHVA